jgi:hypothetical protein
MRPTQIGERVEVDLFGLRLGGELSDAGVASGTIVAVAPGTFVIRLDDHGEVTVGPSRLLARWS